MDLELQAQILELMKTLEGEPPIVLLGSPDPDSSELAALTLTSGDPAYSGPLAGVSLGLPVYHVLEDEVAAAAEPRTYEEQIGLMRMALDVDGIREAVRRVRTGG